MLEDPRESQSSAPASELSRREECTAIPLPVVQPGLPACELRWERPMEGDGGGAVEIVCMAAGGKRLAIKGGGEREMLATCGSCTILREAARRPCLYLVPIKTERDGQIRDYFLCRWFYTLRPEQPATKTDWMCIGCRFWFPRPPVHFFKDLERVTQKLIQYHQDVWAGRTTFPRLYPAPVEWPNCPQVKAVSAGPARAMAGTDVR